MQNEGGARTVVITGGSSGIGLSTARAFARRGDNVVLVARGRDRLDEATRQCEALGGRALAVGRLRPFPDARVYDAMIKPLREVERPADAPPRTS